MNGPVMESLSLALQDMHPRSILQRVFIDCFLKSSSAKSKQPAYYCFFSDLIS
jgi:hypothetical protein